MLETLREYARQKLAESGEEEQVAQAHARTFLELAQRLAPDLFGAGQMPALARLDEEHDNLRAALRWSLDAATEDAIGLPLAAALGQFWYIRGHLSEGREWLTTLLVAANTQHRTAVRAEALRAAGQLAYVQSDYRAAQIWLEESLAIRRELHDRGGVAAVLEQLGEAATEQGDYVTAPQLFAESLAIRRELGDPVGTASVLMNEGWIGLRTGNYAQAVGPLEESLALCRQIGDLDGTAWALAGLGEVAFRQGDLARARALHEESLKLRRELGHKWGTAISLAGLGWVALRQGNRERAIELIGESMGIRLEMGDKGGLAWCLERLAEIAGTQQELERAACLLGAAQTVRTGIGSVVDPGDQPAHAHTIATVRSQLGDAAFAQAWAAGERLTLEEAVAYAREASPPGGHDEHSLALAETHSQGLTPREGEVVALIAQSKSNAEIAAALVLSKRTVETHIGNILAKLGYTSRGQIAAWAIAHGWGDGTP
jgi:DNA-binding CsgD family transcriptional regulator/tetratricopeptide (TPR) repeat protein